MRTLAACCAAVWLALPASALGQGTRPAPPAAGTRPAGEEMIRLNFPEGMEVGILIEYVRKRLGMNLLYDESIGRKRITIAASTEIPKSSLEGLFLSVLKITGLTIVDADQPGWRRIVPSKDFLQLTRQIHDDPKLLQAAPAAVPVTQVFRLEHLTTAAAGKVIEPLMSKPGGNIFPIPERNILVLSDYADHLRHIRQILKLVDQPGPQASVQFVPVRHRSAADLAKQVTDLLKQKADVAGAADRQARPRLTLGADPRGNRIVLVAAAGAEAEALKLIETLDVPSGVTTQTYRLRYASCQRIDKLARSLAQADPAKPPYTSTIDAESNLLIVTASEDIHQRVKSLQEEFDVPPGTKTVTYQFRYVPPRRIDRLVQELTEDRRAKSLYKSTIDEESGLMIVTALPETHERIASLREQLDVVESDPEQSFVRFYKLTNTTASRVMATIQSLGVSEAGPAGLVLPTPGTAADLRPKEPFTGPNTPPGPPGRELPKPPAYTPSTPPATRPARARPANPNQGARVIADENTNTIIVVGPPALQKVYKQLVSMLDKRRPQVMVEMTLVTLDTSNNFSLGVELSRQKGLGGDDSMLVFSSFGLGTVDQATGIIGLPEPGLGFNGVVISPGTVNVVLRALAGCGRGKVLAAPKVLVNDNATASLSSVSEAPFTSVNASDTVSTTSFAGYASAGTTLAVTPHISEGEHVLLQYSITLNSFTDEGGGGIPPPRQTNTVDSEVTVPDGYAVIVGGLSRQDESETITKIPLLGDLPYVKHLFRLITRNRSQNTLFVFLRPVILRDDAFADLKYLSRAELRRAEQPPNLPQSCPVLME